MFDNDLTLNPNGQVAGASNVSKTYSLVGWGGDSSSVRRVSATAMTAPDTLSISHREVKEGGAVYDQHLVRRDSQATGVLGDVHKFSCWLVIKNPKNTVAVTGQMLLDQVMELAAFLRTSTYLNKVLNSEP